MRPVFEGDRHWSLTRTTFSQRRRWPRTSRSSCLAPRRRRRRARRRRSWRRGWRRGTSRTGPGPTWIRAGIAWSRSSSWRSWCRSRGFLFVRFVSNPCVQCSSCSASRSSCRRRSCTGRCCSIETLASRRVTASGWHRAVVAVVFQVLWAVQLAQVGGGDAAANNAAAAESRRWRGVLPAVASHGDAAAVVASPTAISRIWGYIVNIDGQTFLVMFKIVI